MLDPKLLEVISTPPDAPITIVTQGSAEPHPVNTWNSYIQISKDNQLLIPAGGMNKTQENLAQNAKLQLTICNREVQGISYKGTGFLVAGTGAFENEGENYELVKEKYPWARAALVVSVDSAQQTL